MRATLVLAACTLGFHPAAAPLVLAQNSQGMLSQQYTPDARALGMGTAFTAMAEGPAAAFWNPAALGVGSGALAIAVAPASYVRLLSGFVDDVSFYSAAGTVQARGLGFGVNLNRLGYGATPFGGPMLLVEDSSEYTLHVGAGIDVARTLVPRLRGIPVGRGARLDLGLGAGANLKVFHVDFSRSPIFRVPHLEETAIDMDIGSLVVGRVHGDTSAQPGVRPWFAGGRLGVVLSNALDRRMVFDDGTWDPLGRSVRIGLAAEGGTARCSTLGPLLQARATLDVTSFFGRLDRKPDYDWGVELVALDIVAVRAGHEDEGEFEQTTVGFGIGLDVDERWGARFDAANLPSSGSFLEGRTLYSLSLWYSSGSQPSAGGR